MPEQVRCPICGAVVPPSARWCPACGADLRNEVVLLEPVGSGGPPQRHTLGGGGSLRQRPGVAALLMIVAALVAWIVVSPEGTDGAENARESELDESEELDPEETPPTSHGRERPRRTTTTVPSTMAPASIPELGGVRLYTVDRGRVWLIDLGSG